MGPQEPHVCDYMGSEGTHLCVSNIIAVVRGIWETKKAIFKNDYTLEQEPYGAVGDFPAPDGHEFQMVETGQAYLQPVFKKVEMDLTPYGGEEKGIILDACFQEVAVKSGRENFKWCFMDHYPIERTYIYLNVEGNTVNTTSHMAGWGNETRPWDAFHINSMDKDWEGDYLISIRHTNQILKIAGHQNKDGFQAGHVLWQIEGQGGHAGKVSDYELDGFNFSRQHHVRYVNGGPASTTLSLFDNAYEGDNDPSTPYSSGKIITLNHMTKQARLEHEFKHPENLLALAAGSMQTLKNGNQLVGWGWQPYVTEYSKDGKVLFDASFADPESGFSYRTRKYPWIGMPSWSPELLSYSQTCSPKHSPLMAYASWNGATEVKWWRYSISFTDEIGPWYWLGTWPKKGFETEAKLLQGKFKSRFPFASLVSVEALDADKHVLGKTMASTFVPAKENRTSTCGDSGCTHGYDYPIEENAADECANLNGLVYLIPGVLSLIVIIFAMESFATIATRLVDRWSGQITDESYILAEKVKG